MVREGLDSVVGDRVYTRLPLGQEGTGQGWTLPWTDHVASGDQPTLGVGCSGCASQPQSARLCVSWECAFCVLQCNAGALMHMRTVAEGTQLSHAAWHVACFLANLICSHISAMQCERFWLILK